MAKSRYSIELSITDDFLIQENLGDVMNQVADYTCKNQALSHLERLRSEERTEAMAPERTWTVTLEELRCIAARGASYAHQHFSHLTSNEGAYDKTRADVFRDEHAVVYALDGIRDLIREGH